MMIPLVYLYWDVSLTHESISNTLFDISNVHRFKTPLAFIQYFNTSSVSKYNAISLLSFKEKDFWNTKLCVRGCVALDLLISVSIHN